MLTVISIVTIVTMFTKVNLAAMVTIVSNVLIKFLRWGQCKNWSIIKVLKDSNLKKSPTRSSGYNYSGLSKKSLQLGVEKEFLRKWRWLLTWIFITDFSFIFKESMIKAKPANNKGYCRLNVSATNHCDKSCMEWVTVHVVYCLCRLV